MHKVQYLKEFGKTVREKVKENYQVATLYTNGTGITTNLLEIRMELKNEPNLKLRYLIFF